MKKQEGINVDNDKHCSVTKMRMERRGRCHRLEGCSQAQEGKRNEVLTGVGRLAGAAVAGSKRIYQDSHR